MKTAFATRASNFSLASNYSEYIDGISSQFEKLSKRTSAVREDALEDVYESMLKDVKALTSEEPPQRHTLVKKATGILKLSQFQNNRQKSTRAVTAPARDLTNHDYDDFFFAMENRKNKVGAEFRSHLGKNQSEIISKLATNGGNFSQIWDEFEASSNAGISTRPPSRNKMTRSSIVRKSTDIGKSPVASSSAIQKPLWKYFSNHNVLSSSSTTSLASSIGSNRSNFSNLSPNIKPSGQRPVTSQIPQRPKSDYTNQVSVVKGQVITYKANAFSQLTNWFGDEDMLKQCQPFKGEFQRELDLSGFTTSEIKIKLHEGYKLVIEAYRPVRDGLPPLRHKSTILLPDQVSADKLVMCRTSNGRLVIIHIEKFPVGDKKKKKIKK